MKICKYYSQEDKTLRKQLADTLRYIRNNEGLSIPRGNEEAMIESIDTQYGNTSLRDVIEGIDPSDYSSVFVRGGTVEDCDGSPEGYVEIYTYRKQTDKEYFDMVCNYLLPSAYQLAQRQEYLRLKNIFEDNKQ